MFGKRIFVLGFKGCKMFRPCNSNFIMQKMYILKSIYDPKISFEICIPILIKKSLLFISFFIIILVENSLEFMNI